MSIKIEKNNIINLSEDIIRRVEAIAQSHFYTTPSELYYEDHTPLVAYLIKSGRGKLFKKRRKEIPLGPGNLVGLIELMNSEPSTYGAQIEAHSTLLFLDRSTILEIIDHKIDNDLTSLFNNLLIHA